MLDTVRATAEARQVARQEAEKAGDAFVKALKAARDAGAGEGELAKASGLTRQRVWQLLR